MFVSVMANFNTRATFCFYINEANVWMRWPEFWTFEAVQLFKNRSGSRPRDTTKPSNRAGKLSRASWPTDVSISERESAQTLTYACMHTYIIYNKL